MREYLNAFAGSEKYFDLDSQKLHKSFHKVNASKTWYIIEQTETD